MLNFQFLHPRGGQHIYSGPGVSLIGGAWSQLQEGQQFHQGLPAGRFKLLWVSFETYNVQ